MTPFECRYGKKPDLSTVLPFGTICFVKVKDASKIDACAVECRWLGFDATSNGSRIYWPSQCKISMERDITFSSQKIPLLEGEDYSLDNSTDDIQEDVPVKEQNSDDEPDYSDMPDLAPISNAPRRSARLCNLRSNTAISGDEVDEDVLVLEANLDAAHAEMRGLDPRTHQEALRGLYGPQWQEAMDDEIQRLELRNPWEYVDLPKGAHTIGSRWVYKTKLDATNAIASHRARLVAQGFTQVEGIDFYSDDTFAPVVKMSSQHANAALAARRGYAMGQKDVRSAFLYGRLNKDKVIYMRPPPGVALKGIKPGQVL